MRMSIVRTCLAILMLYGVAGVSSAQSNNPDTVYVTTTVSGPKNMEIPLMPARSFHLFEDGVEQKITTFVEPYGSWDINVLLAISQLRPGRIDSLSAAIRDAAEVFKKTANPRHSVKVQELNFGSTGMYAAIDEHLVDLQKSSNPRRALVVITDGFDRQYQSQGGPSDLSLSYDSSSANKLLEYSKHLNIPIFFIFSYDGLGHTLTNAELHDKDTLTIVADQTGGSVDTVDTYGRLVPHCKQLAEELRGRYLLGFVSTNPKKDNKWRKLRLTLDPQEGQKREAEMKKKYFVSKPRK